MDQKVLLTILGEQTDSDGDISEIKLMTTGLLSRYDGGIRVSYKESELSGTDGAEMTIEMEGDAVRVFREGDYSSNFLFREGKRCLNVFHTPFGVIELGAYPSQVEYGVCDDGGEIRLCYDIDMQGRHLGKNRLMMEWKTETGTS